VPRRRLRRPAIKRSRELSIPPFRLPARAFFPSWRGPGQPTPVANASLKSPLRFMWSVWQGRSGSRCFQRTRYRNAR